MPTFRHCVGLTVAVIALGYLLQTMSEAATPDGNPQLVMMGGGRYGFRGNGGNFGGAQRHFGESQRRYFPHGCHSVCSAFGARTRCDGSLPISRSARFRFHTGIDIAIPVGTPLLAIADGVVVKSGRGRSIGGFQVILRHPPQATGLSTYTYSVYDHLMRGSFLPRGTRVHRGERIALSGKSGTLGGYYGDVGFPHLLFKIWDDATDQWPSGKLTDPVAFLHRTRVHTTWPCR